MESFNNKINNVVYEILNSLPETGNTNLAQLQYPCRLHQQFPNILASKSIVMLHLPENWLHLLNN